jgi:Xaa-Pro aminopeptidase
MFARRLVAARQIINESRLQGLLVTSLPNIRYLTGFTGSNAILFLSKDRNLFFTDSRYRSQAPAEVEAARIVITSGSLLEAFSRKIQPRTKGRIGFEASSLTVFAYRTLKDFVKRIKFVPTFGFIEQIRACKDESEISKIKRAAEITDRVFNKILVILKPGITELDVAAEIAYWHRRFGAESEAFDAIVASGARGAFPHARASAQRIKKGDMVTIDMGCRLDGYHCDLTRTIAVGKPQTEMKKIYAVVLDAQRRSIGETKSGVRASWLDGVARTEIARKGYGKYFCHSLGHGLGLEVHELPRISSKSRDVLKPGSVITVEPGIYVPGLGGVRIEDDVVVREDGHEVLSIVPKELVMV